MKLKEIFRTRSKVSTALIGGLGNQMFQYAAGRAISLRQGTELVLDTTPLLRAGENTPRSYALGAFNIDASVDTLSPAQRRRLLLQREKDAPNGWPSKLPRGLRLEGYWQSERYFIEARAQLLREFSLKSPPSSYAAGIADLIGQAPHSVSVHFRRGDYITNPSAAKFHGVLPESYYAQALAVLRQKLPSWHVFVFSDDPQWVRDHVHIEPPCTLIDSTQSSAEQDIWLMGLCRHHVIANSSFSWWGAWLGTQDGLHIAPRRWYLDDQAALHESIVPSSWMRL